MDRLRGLYVLVGRQRGFHVRNHMEVGVVITRFSEVDFVALPVCRIVRAVVRFRIIGRLDLLGS